MATTMKAEPSSHFKYAVVAVVGVVAVFAFILLSLGSRTGSPVDSLDSTTLVPEAVRVIGGGGGGGSSVACSSDADCPSTETRTCNAQGQACTLTKSYSCTNPGTPSSFCESNGGEYGCISCPDGCENGACVGPPDSCQDTEDGGNILQAGTISGSLDGNLYIKTDTCVGTSAVYEYWCEFGLPRNQQIDCPDGTYCSEGACKQGIPPTCVFVYGDQACTSGYTCVYGLGRLTEEYYASTNMTCTGYQGGNSKEYPVACGWAIGTSHCDASLKPSLAEPYYGDVRYSQEISGYLCCK